MHGGVEDIQPYLDEFINFAKINNNLHFYVTKIGCGIAGFKIEEIAPLFSKCIDMDNVSLPIEFINYIKC